MAGGSAVLTADGAWANRKDGAATIANPDGSCPGYELLKCSDGTSSGLALRDVDNADSATTGDVVLYSGTCYTLGCRACGLTPTSSSATKVAGGCSDPSCGGLLALNACCGGSATTGIAAGGAYSTGDAVTDGTHCYVVGYLASGLTLIDPATLSLISGCGDAACPSCTPCCSLPGTSVTINATIRATVTDCGTGGTSVQDFHFTQTVTSSLHVAEFNPCIDPGDGSSLCFVYNFGCNGDSPSGWGGPLNIARPPLPTNICGDPGIGLGIGGIYDPVVAAYVSATGDCSHGTAFVSYAYTDVNGYPGLFTAFISW